jgi:tetraacyldisaccharide 4'-kinase
VSAIERLWYDDTLAARIARMGLAVPAALYGGVVRARGALYDHRGLRVHATRIPVLSLGNLSVGGTGKTPLAAWAAAQLRSLGAAPAVLLRGYGDDEPLVHAALNPDVPVVVDADRVRGVERARGSGADCVVLDDGFQHRRVARTADWVLVSAEPFERSSRLLPAGPMREPVSALSRAHLLVVTRKSAGADAAVAVAERLADRVPGGATAVCRLTPSGLVDTADGTAHGTDRLRGRRVLAVAAIGAPAAFYAQLRELGASELREVPRPDHHRYTSHDVERLLAQAAGADAVVCTLKDAVKLSPLWPHASVPLLYVSQRVEIEQGRAFLDASLATILSARPGTSSTAGTPG